MRKYESYKPIEELWLTQIPASWEDIKIKFLFFERSEKGYPDEPLLVASQNMGVVPKGVYGNRFARLYVVYLFRTEIGQVSVISPEQVLVVGID